MSVKLKTRDDWLAYRMKGIGASDAAAVVGLNPYKTPFQLWAEKTGRAPAPQETDAIRWGKKLERVVADAFEEETGRVIHDPGPFTIYQHPDNPVLMATPDFFWTIPEHEGEGLLEVKTAGAHMREQWDDGPPLPYIVQVQFQFLCTGNQDGSIAALIGGQRFVWKDIPRDDEFINRLRYRVEQFWRDHIEADTPPEPSGQDNSLLGKILPQKDLDLIPATADLMGWDERRGDALRQIKDLERIVEEADSRIKYAIGTHGGIVLPNGVTYTWREHSRPERMVAASTYRSLRRK